jgi:hypothetical protein
MDRRTDGIGKDGRQTSQNTVRVTKSGSYTCRIEMKTESLSAFSGVNSDFIGAPAMTPKQNQKTLKGDQW